MFRRDRDLQLSNKMTGGGIMLCIRRHMCAFLRLEWSQNPFEIMCVTVPARALDLPNSLHIILTYIPPKINNLSEQLEFIRHNLNNMYEKFPNDIYLLLGDFNQPNLQWNETGMTTTNQSTSVGHDLAPAITFVYDLVFLGMQQFNLVENCLQRMLDLCFCNLLLCVTKNSNPLVDEDRYHPSLNIEIVDLYVTHLKENSQTFYNFRKGSYDEINCFLKQHDWSALLNTGSVDDALTYFYSILNESIRLFVPQYIKKSTVSYPNWYSNALIKIIREKNKVHKKWKKSNNPRDYDEFSMLRKRQQRVQKECYNNFITRSECNIKNNPKYFWTYVKSKRGGSAYPNYFVVDNKKETDTQNICNAFNMFFESVFSQPATFTSTSRNCNSLEQDHIDNISSITVSQETVLGMLKGLDKTKGPGCDGIPPTYLANCANSLAPALTILLNRSLRDCIFPTLWKQAHIIPIFKKGSKTAINNYRPISILNTLSKLFEKIILSHIYPLLSRGITTEQHGFLRGRSTISNLACFTDYVLSNMEGGGQVDVIYTDFEKAFDRVDHAILLTKLQYLGIHGDLLRWTASYLKNRSQAVVMGGKRSDFITIPSGIPQGSHLGPLFYNVYIHDVHRYIKHSRHLLYADDKKVFLTIKSKNDCIRLQNDLDNLYQYYNSNNINEIYPNVR